MTVQGGAGPLLPDQMRAVEPDDSVWLSASAGTGKTQVLSSRVLRLLLKDKVSPSQVLCLTFTRAGATEMAARINSQLAKWVRLDDIALGAELKAIGAPFDPTHRARARRLFAQVLDCPGGGLRIDTIHAFSQWLLAAFPLEAGLQPGARAMEDRDRALLARQVLSDLLVHAERDPLGDPQLLTAAAELSLRMGPDKVEEWLMACASAREAWIGTGSWQAADMRDHVLRLLGLPADANEDGLARLCADGVFDTQALKLCHSAYAQWNGKKGQAGRIVIAQWLAAGPSGRLRILEEMHAILFTQKDTVRDQSSLEKYEGGFADAADRVLASSLAVRELRTLLAVADRLVPALRLGRAFALAWEESKVREGFIDFDDQIRLAADLLANSEQAAWIRYKLDRQFDHILVDEAQDTNEAQWKIIFALAEEFWTGLGQRDHLMRTLFVVGDYKQAIFRFQGTNPEHFRSAADRVRSLMAGAAANAAASRTNVRPRELLDLGLGYSFRTAQPILHFVDQAIAAIGYANLGLPRPPDPHVGKDRPGSVVLWAPVGARPGDDLDEEEAAAAEAEAEAAKAGSNWLSRPDRQMADRIATQVRAWLDEGLMLSKGGERRAGPGDFMILVRKRRELAGLIVARLHAAGVPVAGVDRLRLGAPLAVKDLLAALRFASQPLDDLNLAALLVSPLGGWSQDDLLHHGYRDKGVHLWDHLRRSSDPMVTETLERLGDLLRRADFDPPQVILHWLLSGPWQGRRKIVARLGSDANDPIDELLNAAHAYAASSIPSLAGFLAWFDAGDGELKREGGESAGLVRVMTAHGSKGLQAPIVILADAASNPATARAGSIVLADPRDPARRVPLPGLRKEEQLGRIAEVRDRSAREELMEHWRLLYVAMTRAEEALFIGGALSVREKEPAPDSWYARLRLLFDPAQELGDPIWGSRFEWGSPLAFAGRVQEADGRAETRMAALPGWLLSGPPVESRPPRPLAPSAAAEDESPAPPALSGLRGDAARRGVLAHKLLERLPEIPADARSKAAGRWLAGNAPEITVAGHAEIIRDVLAVLSHPDWEDLFGPGSLAEVPIAALSGERVIAGTIDRLLVTPGCIRVADYKTTRSVPATVEAIPHGILRQMAAYALALEAAYSGRRVEAAVLYTAAPRLFVLPTGLLETVKKGLSV